jgi:hypothetical protein
MKDIEKNDVNISNLFQWGAKMTLATPRGDVEVWMKIVGDASINRARVYALRKSADMRKKLKDLESDERIAMIPELDVESKEATVEFLLTLRIREITDLAIPNVKITYPTEPESTASLEEQEQFQATVDSFPAYVEDLTQKEVEKEVEKERKRLSKLSVEDLEKLYISTMIDKITENEMYQAFQDKTVYYACFTDDTYKVPLFSSFDDYLDLPTEAKTKLADFYGTLSLDIDTLKK